MRIILYTNRSLDYHEKILVRILASSITLEDAHLSPMLPIPDYVWEQVLRLAIQQGVVGLVAELVLGLPEEMMPSAEVKMAFMGHLNNQGRYFRTQFSVAAELAEVLSREGVSPYVLKGFSFSTYYDDPSLREFTDCDLYLTKPDAHHTDGASGFAVGNEVAVRLGGMYKKGCYKHSHLEYRGVVFENHHYLVANNDGHQEMAKEQIMVRAFSGAPGRRIGNTQLWPPNTQFVGLHTLYHMHRHFLVEGLSLRMLYDWAVFLRAEQHNLDWQQLCHDLDACGSLQFASVVTAICCGYLGLSVENPIIPRCDDARLVEKVLLDVLRYMPDRSDLDSVGKKARWCIRYRIHMWKFREFATKSGLEMVWENLRFIVRAPFWAFLQLAVGR